MSLIIVILSLTNGLLYAIEPDSQATCAKEAETLITQWRASNPAVNYLGGCIEGGIFLKMNKSDA